MAKQTPFSWISPLINKIWFIFVQLIKLKVLNINYIEFRNFSQYIKLVASIALIKGVSFLAAAMSTKKWRHPRSIYIIISMQKTQVSATKMFKPRWQKGINLSNNFSLKKKSATVMPRITYWHCIALECFPHKDS